MCFPNTRQENDRGYFNQARVALIKKKQKKTFLFLLVCKGQTGLRASLPFDLVDEPEPIMVEPRWFLLWWRFEAALREVAYENWTKKIGLI